MSLSPTSFEILSDLLAIRLESFLVTSGEEAREMRQLKHCQNELIHLQNMARQMMATQRPAPAKAEAKPAPAVPKTANSSAKPKLSRRLQRLVEDLQVEEGRRASF